MPKTFTRPGTVSVSTLRCSQHPARVRPPKPSRASRHGLAPAPREKMTLSLEDQVRAYLDATRGLTDVALKLQTAPDE